MAKKDEKTDAKRTPDQPLSLVPKGDEANPTPPVRRFRLNSLKGIRREAAAVYRSVRIGELAPENGTKLVYMLGQIGRLAELEDLETRIRALEEEDEY